jgi:hypothetical protein
MDKRLYFELMVELSHKDTWVHYYFVYYNKLDHLQLEAARIVTGLPIFASQF